MLLNSQRHMPPNYRVIAKHIAFTCGVLPAVTTLVFVLLYVCELQDLHHPAMRDRHWKMLMQTTGKLFTMDEKFCLGDLLALELHNYVDACR